MLRIEVKEQVTETEKANLPVLRYKYMTPLSKQANNPTFVELSP